MDQFNMGDARARAQDVIRDAARAGQRALQELRRHPDADAAVEIGFHTATVTLERAGQMAEEWGFGDLAEEAARRLRQLDAGYNALVEVA